MNNYEMYMIDTLKYWGDKVRNNVGTEDYLMCCNVFDEISNIYVAYKNSTVGVSIVSPLADEPMELSSISA